jgi:hypothetical protein
LIAYFSRSEDHTYYRVSSQPQSVPNLKPAIPPQGLGIFTSGERTKEQIKKAEAQAKIHKVAIRYQADQILGVSRKSSRVMKTGSRLVGFLLDPIDSRSPSLVRVSIPHGGESGGIEISPGSTLIGHFTYAGNGDKVYLDFARLDDPDGFSRIVKAQATDISDYTVGIHAEVYTGEGIKVASQLGLTMLAGLADVMTGREPAGLFSGSSSAKPTLKNGLFQGASRAAQGQASRTANEIQSVKDYATLNAGQPLIIELTEDLKDVRK